MGAVWMRVRAELRARWRATVALGLLVAFGGGAVIALAQAARRTDSAYPRFLREHAGAHVVVFNHPFEAQPVPRAQLEAIPEVAEVEGIKFQPIAVGDAFVPAFSREHDPFAAGAVDRFKVLEGRAADPTRVDEVVVTMLGEERAGEDDYADVPLDVGDEIELRFFDPPPDEFAEYGRAINADPVTARIVGRVAVPGGFPPQVTEIGALLYMTPAFFERYPYGFGGSVPSSFLVRLERGPADIASFNAAVADVTGGRPPFVFARDKQDANVQSGIHLQALAIWLLATIAGLAVLMIVAQTLARQVFLDTRDHPSLRALGMAPSELVAAVVARMLVTLFVGAAGAVALAASVSAVAPFGLARVAEPTPGPSFDTFASAVGVATIVIVGSVVVTLSAWGSARRQARADDVRRPSVLAGALAAAGGGAVLPAGARLALDPGRGRRAVPVRATVASIAVALGALVASLTFDASLHALLDDPRQHGVGWDVAIGADASEGLPFPGDGRALLDLPGVDGVGIGSLGAPLTFDGVYAETVAFDAVGGNVGLVVIEGRAPRDVGSDDPIEVLLGTRTMREMGVRIGDTVDIGLDQQYGAAQETHEGTIVGRGIPPSNSEVTRLGEGAVVTTSGIRRIAGERFAAETQPDVAFLSLEPGADLSALEDLLAERYTPGRPFDDLLYKPPLAKPNDLVAFARVSDLPLVLTGIIGFLCLAILVHTLVSSVRRRRGDLAVLKTLGFGRAQVFGVVATQSAVLALVAAVVGVPLGAIVGRLSWDAFAGAIGAVPGATTPVASVALLVPAALVLGVVIAAFPARAAARTRPAVVLRTE